MGAGRLGIAKRKASRGDDNVDELGVSARERVNSGLEIRVHFGISKTLEF